MWIIVCNCVMEYGKIRRIYIIVLIGAISEILEYKTIEAYYWTDYDDRQHCLQCDPKSFLGDPLDIWDKFPCPPEWDPDLFFDLDWTGRLGPTEGEIIRQRVAKRCGLSISSSAGPRPGYAESSLFIKNCDIDCILVVLAVLVCSVVLSVPLVLCCYKRRNVCKWVTKKTLNRHSTTRDAPLYGESFYPPLNSSITRDSEIVYNADGAQTRLLHHERSHGESAVSPYRYYEKIYNDKDPPDPDNDIAANQHKTSSEETSLTYSGTDTTHTYESLKDSQRSASFRLSNTSNTSAQIQNPTERAEQQYNASLASSSQRQCACPRCSRTNIYRPYDSVDYNSTYNVYPQKMTYPYNRFQQYRIPSPSGGGVSDNESEAMRYNSKRTMSGGTPDNASYIEEPAPPDGLQKEPSLYDSDTYYGSANSDYQYRRNKCNCRKCSHTNLEYSQKLISPDNQADSTFYGVPDQMTINMVPLRPCNCRRCSQNNLNQINNDLQHQWFYNQRQPCACKRCLQTFQQINPTIESYVYDPNVDQNQPTDRRSDKARTESKKKKKNKSERPLSVHASSTDTNTGSEKSYRMGVPKTNGSLYRSKLSKT